GDGFARTLQKHAVIESHARCRRPRREPRPPETRFGELAAQQRDHVHEPLSELRAAAPVPAVALHAEIRRIVDLKEPHALLVEAVQPLANVTRKLAGT